MLSGLFFAPFVYGPSTSSRPLVESSCLALSASRESPIKVECRVMLRLETRRLGGSGIRLQFSAGRARQVLHAQGSKQRPSA